MNNQNEKIVMMDSLEAAEYRTNLTGWVSRHGRYFGTDERTARYDGCTHRTCEDCGKTIIRNLLICNDCYKLKQDAKYQTMPKEQWNGIIGGVYSRAYDKYFWSWDEVEYYCENEDIKESDLQLVICEPTHLPLLDRDYGCDELPEDGELPDKVWKAIDDFNTVVKDCKPVSWSPVNKAAVR